MSADLQWELVRRQSCFIIKRNGVTFNREPNNLVQRNTRKHSGLVNKNPVGITSAEKGIVLTTKARKCPNKPKAAYRSVVLNGNKGPRRVLRAVASIVALDHYNPMLKMAALRRASAILLSQKPRKAAVVKSRTKKTKPVA